MLSLGCAPVSPKERRAAQKTAFARLKSAAKSQTPIARLEQERASRLRSTAIEYFGKVNNNKRKSVPKKEKCRKKEVPTIGGGIAKIGKIKKREKSLVYRNRVTGKKAKKASIFKNRKVSFMEEIMSKQKIKEIAVILFFVGGFAYAGVELLWRGYTHVSMFVLGGFCTAAVFLLHRRLAALPVLLRALLACALITAAEFVCGVIANLVLRLNVWDYSAEPFSFLGQITLQYSLYWFLVSLLLATPCARSR